MLPFTRLMLTALLFVINVVNAIPEADGSSRRSLFIFHTGSYNEVVTWQLIWKLSWKNVHTVLVYSPHPMLAEHARSVRATLQCLQGHRPILVTPHTKENIANTINSCTSSKAAMRLI